MNFKIFLESNEITDDEIIIKLMPYLGINCDWMYIQPQDYIVKISEVNNIQYKVEYFTYGNLLQYFLRLDKKEISYILREYTLNKILND